MQLNTRNILAMSLLVGIGAFLAAGALHGWDGERCERATTYDLNGTATGYAESCLNEPRPYLPLYLFGLVIVGYFGTHLWIFGWFNDAEATP